MDRQTLRDWVLRYNEGGVDALKSRKNAGRIPYLTEAQMAELRQLVVDGPDLATDKVVRWRIADLHGVVQRRYSVDVHHPSTVGKWLHQLRLTRLQLRPVHPKKDPEAETTLKKFRQPGKAGASIDHGIGGAIAEACLSAGSAFLSNVPTSVHPVDSSQCALLSSSWTPGVAEQLISGACWAVRLFARPPASWRTVW